MQRQDGWWWYGIDMEQAATYKYSEGDIDSARQFSKTAVLMCVRVGAGTNLDDVLGTFLEEEDLMNCDKNVTDGNGREKRSLQSPQQRRKFPKGGKNPQAEIGVSKKTENAGNMQFGVSSLY